MELTAEQMHDIAFLLETLEHLDKESIVLSRINVNCGKTGRPLGSVIVADTTWLYAPNERTSDD